MTLRLLMKTEKIKIYKIFIDGIDKSGKDTIVGYIDKLSGHKYAVKSRGVLSLIAYAKLFNRNFKYDLCSEKCALHVIVDVSKEDWQVRCKMTNEPKIDYQKNVNAFKYAEAIGKKNKLRIIHVDSTRNTPYSIAKQIINYATKMNKEK